MKYYSEVLSKLYDTAEELKKEEEKHYAATEAKRLAREQAKTRKKEVDDAVDKAQELIHAYIRDYGSYSKSTGSTATNYIQELLESIW